MMEAADPGSVLAFAHTAVLELATGGDARAPGGAITVALCGANEHQPPCRLAAHFTGVEQEGPRVELRILFASAARDEQQVRDLIDAALHAGVFVGPDGVTSRWRLDAHGPSEVRPAEYDHTLRLRDSTATT